MIWKSSNYPQFLFSASALMKGASEVPLSNIVLSFLSRWNCCLKRHDVATETQYKTKTVHLQNGNRSGSWLPDCLQKSQSLALGLGRNPPLHSRTRDNKSGGNYLVPESLSSTTQETKRRSPPLITTLNDGGRPQTTHTHTISFSVLVHTYIYTVEWC